MFQGRLEIKKQEGACSFSFHFSCSFKSTQMAKKV